MDKLWYIHDQVIVFTTKGHKETFWGDANILYLDHIDGYIPVWVLKLTDMYTKR